MRGWDRPWRGLTIILKYVLGEAPPGQNDSNIWSVKIDPHTGKPLGLAMHLRSVQAESNTSAARPMGNGWPT